MTLWMWCPCFSLRWLLLLQSTGSVVVARRLNCSVACGVLLDQGSNPCLLHWQADYSLSHQGSSDNIILKFSLERKESVKLQENR